MLEGVGVVGQVGAAGRVVAVAARPGAVAGVPRPRVVGLAEPVLGLSTVTGVAEAASTQTAV